jgi:hypothetical protein
MVIVLAVAGASTARAEDTRSVEGEVTVSGALAGTLRWNPELALFCGCVSERKVGRMQVTLTDGAGTFIAIDADMDGELVLTSGKLKETMKGTGRAGTCSSKGTDHQRVDLPLEATVKGKSGAAATVKGHLVCAQSR